MYNGDGYTSPQINDQMSFQVRGTLRPLPMIPIIKGLRLTGFYDHDHYREGREEGTRHRPAHVREPVRQLRRPVRKVEGPERLRRHRSSTTKGYSIWATPRLPDCGLEALLRWDRVTPNDAKPDRKQRLIAGPAYWFPVTKAGVATAVMLKFEQIRYMGAPRSRPTEERYALHTLFNF